MTEHEYILCYKKYNFDFIFDESKIDEKTFNKYLHNKKCKFIKLEKWGSSAYREDRPSLYYSIKDPSDKDYYPKAPDGREGRWRSKPEKLKSNNITWIERRNNLIPYEVIYFEDVQDKMGIIKERSILYDIASTTDAAKDIIALFGKKIFDTPKPERLIHRILTLATNEGDLVLDSFLGSGTTVAVAHKMGRRYIGIEMGEHAKTHCAARLQKVIDGEQGGISKDVNWQGGGGFRFYNLGEAIFDEEGKINKKIRFEHLAAHIWFSETKTPLTQKDKSPLLGVHNDIAYYLLYNGILGDKTIDGGNVLNSKTLVTVSPEEFSFSFDPNNYPANILYEGKFGFTKHYYSRIAIMNEEEAKCARAIDETSQVKYWVRNLDRDSKYAFWLPTATDRFYPDFVAKLNDERFLIVEYKGDHLKNEDTEEKELIGKVWAKKSGNLFLMAWKKDQKGRDLYSQIKKALQ